MFLYAVQLHDDLVSTSMKRQNSILQISFKYKKLDFTSGSSLKRVQSLQCIHNVPIKKCQYEHENRLSKTFNEILSLEPDSFIELTLDKVQTRNDNDSTDLQHLLSQFDSQRVH